MASLNLSLNFRDLGYLDLMFWRDQVFLLVVDDAVRYKLATLTPDKSFASLEKAYRRGWCQRFRTFRVIKHRLGNRNVRDLPRVTRYKVGARDGWRRPYRTVSHQQAHGLDADTPQSIRIDVGSGWSRH